MAVLLVAACDPGEREARPYTGLWESEGFGLYLDVHGGEVDVYEHSDAHCLRISSSGARGLSNVLQLEGDRLLLRDGGRVVGFDPIPVLPVRCAGPADDSPVAVLGAAAASIEEHLYPAPPEGWDDGLIPSASSSATPSDVYADLVAVLAVLEEPEVRVAAGSLPRWPEAPALAAALSARANPLWEGRAFTSTPASGVAYIGFTGLVVEGEGDQRSLAAALDGALADAGAVIVDLRGASGGNEEAASQVATRFLITQQVVATLEARTGGGLVAAGSLTVTPRPTGTFRGAVVVLVGPDTSGAGELLARILGDLPGVVVLGEPTAGSPREPLVRSLPNGWSLGIPNVEVLGPDGTSWVTPLIPDVLVPTTAEDIEAGSDPGLEAALLVLSEA